MNNLYAILGLALTGLAFVCQQWMKSSQDRAIGGQLEAAKTDQVTATAQAAIAQAEVSAPATPAAILDRLKSGTV